MLNKIEWCEKLALGTAQFGLDYGISNKAGKVSSTTVIDILTLATREGIKTLDTAIAYGNSEKIIGQSLRQGKFEFDVISKFPPGTTPGEIFSLLKRSLEKLQIDSLSGFLAHQASDWLTIGMPEILLAAREENLVQKIGLSAYYPDDIKYNDKFVPWPNLVQIPFNVFDQRFRPFLLTMNSNGVEIHARSLFLQGLFFVKPPDLNEHFKSVGKAVSKLQHLAKETDIPLSAMLINWAIDIKEIDKLIIGVTSVSELEKNLSAWDYYPLAPVLKSQLDSFAIDDEQVLLPFNWR